MIWVMIVFGGIMIFVVFILPIINNVTDYSKEKIQNIKDTVSEKNAGIEEIRQINSRAEEYELTKSRFQYLSDETLQEYYNKKEGNESPFYMLALEEILVERKIIKFSPTHEKLEKMGKFFRDN